MNRRAMRTTGLGYVRPLCPGCLSGHHERHSDTFTSRTGSLRACDCTCTDSDQAYVGLVSESASPVTRNLARTYAS